MSDLAARALRFQYVNYRGESSMRWATPLDLSWGATEYHPEPQWIMRAFDHEKGAVRGFALADCSFESAKEQNENET